MKINQNEEMTSNQIGYMQPEFKSNLTKAAVNKLQGKVGAKSKQHRQQRLWQQMVMFQYTETKVTQEETLFYLQHRASTPKEHATCKKSCLL